jgi:CheY-like chemotaxis protein
MKRILLRAEVETEGHAPFVAHTLELDETEAFVETDVPLEIGAVVRMRLSFPRLVAPFSVTGRVTAHADSSAPGEPAGVELVIDPVSPADAAVLRTVLVTLAEGPHAEALEGFHVLLVEDNNLIRDMFSYGIRKYFRGKPGYVTVDHAADGASAWKMLSSGTYDLAIVDYFLPELDGAQLVQRMRAEPSPSSRSASAARRRATPPWPRAPTCSSTNRSSSRTSSPRSSGSMRTEPSDDRPQAKADPDRR